MPIQINVYVYPYFSSSNLLSDLYIKASQILEKAYIPSTQLQGTTAWWEPRTNGKIIFSFLFTPTQYKGDTVY